MDISQAAFGLDMRSASRIYFISPVLNPQVVAQAIGRARRISQKKPVSVETLVLRNSIEEVMIERRDHMTQAELSKIKNVLDDNKIKEWIRNPKINPIPIDEISGLEQTALLSSPQYIFGRGFGRPFHPDQGLVESSPERKNNAHSTEPRQGTHVPFRLNGGLKRPRTPEHAEDTDQKTSPEATASAHTPKRQARVAWVDQEA